MKRAAFRLQPVLEVRRTQERAAALAAAEAARAAADADHRATELEDYVAEIAGVARRPDPGFEAARGLVEVPR